MKKTFLIFITFSFNVVALPQQIVHDPVLTQLATEEAVDRQVIKAKSIDQLLESIKQTEELQKTYDLFQKTYEELERVNDFLKNLEIIEQAIQRQQRLLERTNKLIGDFERSDLFSVEEYGRITENLMALIDGCTNIIEMFDLVITQGKTRMNDAERMELMLQIRDDLNEKHAVTDATLDYYEHVKDQREALKALEKTYRKLNEK